MLVLEQSRRQQFAEQVYDSENSNQSQTPFCGLPMDSYDVIDPMLQFHPLSYSIFENPSIFATEPMATIKEEMYQLHEFPPALVSSGSAPSIASAASSTVGSPYSGPLHTISSQDGHDHTGPYGLGLMPALLRHESFHQELLGAPMEAELSNSNNYDNNNHAKLFSDRSYVGECADLSSCSAPVSATISEPKSRFGHRPPPDHASRASHRVCLTALSEVSSIPDRSDRDDSTAPSVVPTSGFCSNAHHPHYPSHHDFYRATPPVFKPPSTPASALSRHYSSVFCPVNARPPSLSAAASSHMVPNDAYAASCSPSVNRVQSYSFARNNGSFVPPLDSSCSSLPALASLHPLSSRMSQLLSPLLPL